MLYICRKAITKIISDRPASFTNYQCSTLTITRLKEVSRPLLYLARFLFIKSFSTILLNRCAKCRLEANRQLSCIMARYILIQPATYFSNNILVYQLISGCVITLILDQTSGWLRLDIYVAVSNLIDWLSSQVY